MGNTWKTRIIKGVDVNGIRGPSHDSVAFRIWEAFDLLTAIDESGAIVVPGLDACLKASALRKFNEGNVRTEYGRWRKYNGDDFAVAGRTAAEDRSAPLGQRGYQM